MIRRSVVQILAESVIVWALGKSISTAPSYQRSKKWYSENSDGIVSSVHYVHQWAARLYAPWGGDMESGMKFSALMCWYLKHKNK